MRLLAVLRRQQRDGRSSLRRLPLPAQADTFPLQSPASTPDSLAVGASA